MKKNSHVREQILAQAGGWCMVDFFMLHDGTTMGITDEYVGLCHQGMDDEFDEDQGIGEIYIDRFGDNCNIDYPKPTPHHRTIGERNPNLTGWYIEKHEVKSDDGIIHYDAIIMRNGIYITIDDAQITVYTSTTEEECIDTIERPCAVMGDFDENGDCI